MAGARTRGTRAARAGDEAGSGAAAATWGQLLALRAERQHIVTRTTPDRLVDVARTLVGLHAQVMSAAELQLAARIDGLRAADVRDALWEQRRLVKVWAFRNTLHLLAPDDLVDFVAAARTRERWRSDGWLRYFEMTLDDVEALIAAAGEVLTDRPMTRAQLAEAIARRLRRPDLAEKMLTGWGTFLGAPAQRGQLIFGPSDGRNVTFVNAAAWLGRSVAASDGANDEAAVEALGRLIARYLAAFPGSSRDMIARWWGGTGVSAVNRAIAGTQVALAEVRVDGVGGFVLARDVEAVASAEPFRGVRLLPGFDPFTNELPRRVEAAMPVAHHERVHRTAGWVTPIVLVDGRVAGTWEIAGGAKAGRVEVTPWRRWRGGARAELGAEVERIAAFLDRPLGVEIGAAVR